MRSFHFHTASNRRISIHPRHYISVLLVLAVLTLLLLGVFPRAAAAEGRAQALILEEGKQEYSENCAYCHGADGKGKGALANSLVKQPKDLTAIAAANGSQFPFWHIFYIIAGEAAVPGHDTHQMPDFYARLKSQDLNPGYLPAHVRVLELTHYLESLQGK